MVNRLFRKGKLAFTEIESHLLVLFMIRTSITDKWNSDSSRIFKNSMITDLDFEFLVSIHHLILNNLFLSCLINSHFLLVRNHIFLFTWSRNNFVNDSYQIFSTVHTESNDNSLSKISPHDWINMFSHLNPICQNHLKIIERWKIWIQMFLCYYFVTLLNWRRISAGWASIIWRRAWIWTWITVAATRWAHVAIPRLLSFLLGLKSKQSQNHFANKINVLTPDAP